MKVHPFLVVIAVMVVGMMILTAYVARTIAHRVDHAPKTYTELKIMTLNDHQFAVAVTSNSSGSSISCSMVELQEPKWQ